MHVDEVLCHGENAGDNMGNFTSRLYDEEGYK